MRASHAALALLILATLSPLAQALPEEYPFERFFDRATARFEFCDKDWRASSNGQTMSRNGCTLPGASDVTGRCSIWWFNGIPMGVTCERV